MYMLGADGLLIFGIIMAVLSLIATGVVLYFLVFKEMIQKAIDNKAKKAAELEKSASKAGEAFASRDKAKSDDSTAGEVDSILKNIKGRKTGSEGDTKKDETKKDDTKKKK